MKPGQRARAILLTLGAIAGLGLKWPMLFYMGVFDMDAYDDWGQRALRIGLPQSYHGIYFPLQYQIFESCAWIVERSGMQFFTVFKASNLIFDLGSFCLLILMLKRQGSNPLYALCYWLHPWFLAVSSLGYIDFQFSFFVLLSIWLLRGESSADYFLAGLALGCAFVMKPQAQILLIATFFYCFFRYLRSKDARPMAMLAGPVLLFLCYETYFICSLPIRPRYLAAVTLPKSYLAISNVMPALTAQMTNIWYPIAYFLKAPDQPIYSVSDRIHLLPLIPAKFLAASIVISLVGLQVFRVEGDISTSTSDKFVRIFGFAAMIVPFVMTSGHENHLFLGTVLLVLLMGRSLSTPAMVAAQLLLLVQFLHIYSLYGIQPGGLAELAHRTQSDGVAVVYSCVSLICFGFLARPLWSVNATRDPSRAC